jgi:hypothetical protein
VSTIVAPLAVGHELGDLLVALGAVLEDDAREGRAGGVHPDGRVRAEHELTDRPDQRGGGLLAAELLGDLQTPPLGVHPRLVALGEGGVHGDRHRLGVVDGRVAVGVLEGGGEVLAGQPLGLGEDALRGVEVELLERTGAEDVLTSEQLEKVELDVAQVALVVAHDCLFLDRGCGVRCTRVTDGCYRQVTSSIRR